MTGHLRSLLRLHQHDWSEWRWWGPTSLMAERRCTVCGKAKSRRF